jgi:hypothetical protein
MTANEKQQRLAANKAAMVAAHKAGDHERLRELSAEKQALKQKRFCQWPECGVPLSRHGSYHCFAHNIMHRWYSHRLNFAATAALVLLLAGCAHVTGDYSKLGQTEGTYLERTEMPGETTIRYTTPEFHYEQR